MSKGQIKDFIARQYIPDSSGHVTVRFSAVVDLGGDTYGVGFVPDWMKPMLTPRPVGWQNGLPVYGLANSSSSGES